MAATSTPSAVKGIYWKTPYSGINVADIDANLYTHIFCAFANLDPHSNQVTIPQLDGRDDDNFTTFTETLQRSNSRISTLLSIGGAKLPANNFSVMASQEDTRNSFIKSSIVLARKYNFFGLDIDWEHPKGEKDMNNFALLLKEWRIAVTEEARSSDKSPLLLTAAVYCSPIPYDDPYPYPVNSINTNLDWVNVMTYDYYGPAPDWAPGRTHAPAALYRDEINTDAAIQTWIRMGLSPGKIALGLPFYGYAWKLKDPNINGIGAEADGAAADDDREIWNEGDIAYKKIQEYFIQTGVPAIYDDNLVTNYCYDGTTWIGYDNEISIKEKVLFARKKGLLGYFAWSVGHDYNFVLSRTAHDAWL